MKFKWQIKLTVAAFAMFPLIDISAGDRPADLLARPGGLLRLLDADVTFRPGLYTENWQFSGSSATASGYVPNADGSWNFEIRHGGGLQGSAVFAKLSDGCVGASWTIEPKADVESNGLVVMSALDGEVWRGGWVEADGLRIGLPIVSASSRILSGAVSKLTFSDAKSERCFTLEFDKPQLLLLQDDRAVVSSCSTLTLRLFLSSGRCSAGKQYRLDVRLSGKSVNEIEEIHPVTIAEGAEWMPIVCDPDVIRGSALDFSGVIACRHRPAGRFGRVIAVGEDFQFEGLPGVAQRFAGANVCGPSVALDEEVSKKLAKRFSAIGYNSVRIHNHDWVFCRNQADGTALDEAALQKFDALFAAFKEEGHYMTIDLFVNRKVPWRSCGIDRDGILSMGDFKLWVHFHEGVFSNFLAHADAFLTRVNTKTGIRYADDPALAFVSLVNEGNLGNNGREGLKKCPEAAAALAEYVAAHGGKDDEAVLNGFYAERERLFARRVRKHVREGLKCRVLLTNMNVWFYTPEIDKVRATEFDYADQHCYVAHPTFLGKDWSLPTAGDMRNPLEGSEALCLASRRLPGCPFACSEWNYCAPLPARAQAGLVMGSLAASGRWNALWRYAWSDNPQPVLDPRSTPVQFFMIGADPLALATERATTSLFLRHDADALGAALERARRERRIVVNAKGTSGGWCAGGDLDAGFLKARLSGPAAVWVSALDGADLAKARRLVVFHLTEVLNSGMKFSDGRLTMMSDDGHLPLLVRKGEAKVAVPLEGAGWRLYALASNGARKKELALRESHGHKVFEAKTDCDTSEGTLTYELIRENLPAADVSPER